MTKRLILSFLAFATLTITGHSAPFGPEISSTTLKRIELLAHADDLIDQNLRQEKTRLTEESDAIFSDLSKIIQESLDDRVLNVAFAIAVAAKSRKSDLVNLAVEFLKTRDPKNFSLSTQRALSIVGSGGDYTNIALLKRFLSNPEILIRTAAKKGIEELEGYRDTPPSQRPTVSGNSKPVSQNNVALSNTHETEVVTPCKNSSHDLKAPERLQQSHPEKPSPEPQPSASDTGPFRSMLWTTTAAVIVSALGLLWLFVKKRKEP